jgi:phosphoribosylglycinamide formyltransferase-1
MASPLHIGVLLSGSGTNLQAIIDAIARHDLHASIQVVISNRPDAYGLTRARQSHLPAVVLQDHHVELVVLAGFMRLLSPFFVRMFPQKILNIHPALLPAFPGTHAQRQALQYGVRISGATVHFVDEEVDHGPIVIQAAVPVYPDDTEASLSARILTQEHLIYPQAIQLFAEGRLEIRGRFVVVHNEPHSLPRALCAPASS